MNVGVFGGTFDPPHIGHLIVGEHVREALGLGKLIFVPTAIPPHKQDQQITDAHHRLSMLRLAAGDNPSLSVSSYEVEKGGVSYTVQTLTEFKRQMRGDAFYLLIGMDNLADFRTWREPEKILSLATVVVMTRPGVRPGADDFLGDPRVRLVEVPAIGIASTLLRQRVREGKSIRYFVPSDVEKYIVRHGLYRPPNG